MSGKQKNLTEELTAVLEEIVEEPVVKESKKGEAVVVLSETDFMIGNRQYKLVANYREGFVLEKIGERYSEVLARYDYIVGDWGYEQLRLRGFFEASNRKAMPEQRIDALEDYLYEYCNFGCAYFVIQRVGGKREKNQQRRRKPKQPTNQAHISEKKEFVKSQKVKPKAKIKNRQPKVKTDEEKKEKNKGFTIRKRED
ncbi:YutD family protein [Enterococcus sp. LJL98]